MKQDEIHFADLNRWLFGQVPPVFMLEVLLRTFIIYLFLLLVIRLMGKRMVLPDWDKEFITEKLEPAGVTLFNRWGTPAPVSGQLSGCPHCGSNDWTMAVKEKSA